MKQFCRTTKIIGHLQWSGNIIIKSTVCSESECGISLTSVNISPLRKNNMKALWRPFTKEVLINHKLHACYNVCNWSLFRRTRKVKVKSWWHNCIPVQKFNISSWVSYVTISSPYFTINASSFSSVRSLWFHHLPHSALPETWTADRRWSLSIYRPAFITIYV